MEFPNSLIVKRTVEPVNYAVSLADVKASVLPAGTTDDDLITGFLEAAIREAEDITGRQLVTATFQMKMDTFPASDKIILYHPPLQSVSSITYVDTAGATQTLSTDVYGIDTTSEPGLIYLKYGQYWPSCRGYHNDVTITYVAGYLATEVVTLTVTGNGAGNNVPAGTFTRYATDNNDRNIYLNTAYLETATYWILYSPTVTPNGWVLANIAGTVYWQPDDETTLAGAYSPFLAAVGTATVSAHTSTLTDTVPERIRAAIKLLVGAYYDPIRSGSEDQAEAMRKAAYRLLEMEKVQQL